MVRPGLQSFRLLVSESKENAKYNDNFLNGNFLIYLISILHHSREPIKKVWKIQHFGEKGFRTGSFSTLFFKSHFRPFFQLKKKLKIFHTFARRKGRGGSDPSVEFSTLLFLTGSLFPYWIGPPSEAGVTRFSQYSPSSPRMQEQCAAVLQHII